MCAPLVGAPWYHSKFLDKTYSIGKFALSTCYSTMASFFGLCASDFPTGSGMISAVVCDSGYAVYGTDSLLDNACTVVDSSGAFAFRLWLVCGEPVGSL